MAKVLIVDDDAGIRSLLTALFREEGYMVRVVSDGQEALDLLESEGGFVVLLDWVMPHLDGGAVLEYLSAHTDVWDGNSVILMTANTGFSAEQLRLMAEVAAALLPKPFEVDELVALVQGAAQVGPHWEHAAVKAQSHM